MGLVALTLAARWLRLRLRHRNRVQISYHGQRPVSFEAATGLTLLEMARENDIPHANICRGRGRCGTCRVRVLSGASSLAPAGQTETKVLKRWHAGPDERLACQLKPQKGQLVVERVIEADYSNLDYSVTKNDPNLTAGTVG